MFESDLIVNLFTGEVSQSVQIYSPAGWESNEVDSSWIRFVHRGSFAPNLKLTDSRRRGYSSIQILGWFAAMCQCFMHTWWRVCPRSKLAIGALSSFLNLCHSHALLYWLDAYVQTNLYPWPITAWQILFFNIMKILISMVTWLHNKRFPLNWVTRITYSLDCILNAASTSYWNGNSWILFMIKIWMLTFPFFLTFMDVGRPEFNVGTVSPSYRRYTSG